MINGHLSGQPQTSQPSQGFDPNAFKQQFRQELFAEIGQHRQAAMNERAHADIAEFSKDKEFWDDVADDVSYRMAFAAQRGRKLTIEQAYQQAIRDNEGISDILAKRDAAAAAKATQASMQQARAAASSVKSTPSTAASSVKDPRKMNYQEIVSASWDTLEGR